MGEGEHGGEGGDVVAQEWKLLFWGLEGVRKRWRRKK